MENDQPGPNPLQGHTYIPQRFQKRWLVNPPKNRVALVFTHSLAKFIIFFPLRYLVWSPLISIHSILLFNADKGENDGGLLESRKNLLPHISQIECIFCAEIKVCQVTPELRYWILTRELLRNTWLETQDYSQWYSEKKVKVQNSARGWRWPELEWDFLLKQ